jgi:uncharacterized protein YigE (DUF2233 family)
LSISTEAILVSLLILVGDGWLLFRFGIPMLKAEPATPEAPAPLASPGLKPAPEVAPEAPVDQTMVTFGDLRFHVREVDLAAADLRLVWKDPASGERFGSLGKLEAALAQKGETLLFATNSGMFRPDYRPVGLHIEAGKELVALDEQRGPEGNFYLQPNGVFFVRENGQPGILTTENFARERPGDLRLATQSGPMLLIDGKIHKSFNPKSQSRYIRSGVGWRGGTRVVFALSATPVTFHEFARFFLEEYGCSEALYLDGAISRFHAPELGHSDPEGDFGGILALVGRNPKPPGEN